MTRMREMRILGRLFHLQAMEEGAPKVTMAKSGRACRANQVASG